MFARYDSNTTLMNAHITFYGLMCTIQLETISVLLYVYFIWNSCDLLPLCVDISAKCIDRLYRSSTEIFRKTFVLGVDRTWAVKTRQKNKRNPDCVWFFQCVSFIAKVHMANHNTPLNITTVSIVHICIYIPSLLSYKLYLDMSDPIINHVRNTIINIIIRKCQSKYLWLWMWLSSGWQRKLRKFTLRSKSFRSVAMTISFLFFPRLLCKSHSYQQCQVIRIKFNSISTCVRQKGARIYVSFGPGLE